MLLVLVLIIAVVVGLGFYRGWFHFSSGSNNKKAHITVSVDKSQFQEDKNKAVDRVATTTQKAQD